MSYPFPNPRPNELWLLKKSCRTNAFEDKLRSTINRQTMKKKEMDRPEQLNGQRIAILGKGEPVPHKLPNFLIWSEDVEDALDKLPDEPTFDLVVTSPPYNIGKDYEAKPLELDNYRIWQKRV